MNTFIFGLDGASPDLIDEWIREGHLPHLKKIKRDGVYGKLESTFPPITGPAWASFQTGVNPGKHGVFNWLDVSESYQGRAINSTSLRTRTVWNIISRHQGEVGLLSLPVTYPPERINGFLVPGFLTPQDGHPISFPEKAFVELKEEVPNFEFKPPYFNPTTTPRKWVKQLRSFTRARGRGAKFLYKKYEPSVFMVHFFSTDTVQHKLWNYNEDDWDPRLEVFKEVDRQIGKIMEAAPDNSTFIAVSDHGFGPMRKIFNVNNWLYKNNLLEFKNNTGSFLKKKLSDIGFTQERLKPVGETLYPLAEALNLIDNYTTDPLTDGKLNTIFLSHRDVDWNNTRAYSRADIGHIRINQEGREQQGIVDDQSYRMLQEKLMRQLEEVKLPDNDQKLTNWIRPKDEVYNGPFIKEAPDILFNPLPQETAGYGASMFTSSEVFDLETSFDPGNHRRNGLLLASGPSVESKQRDAAIEDIAPTLLNLHSYPIPEQMDGQVIREISPEEPNFNRPKDFYKSRKKTSETGDSRNKLRNLGYL
ncbi:MAG: alkaline phosphatase family protein [Candidatus Acetothermia bacterium]